VRRRARRDLVSLHTTEARGSVGVARGEILATRTFESAGQHAPALLSAVRRLMDEAAVGLADLDGVVVSTGPGSFTGIRIGLATAQGLAAARGWPVLSCDSLTALAGCFMGEEAPLAVVQGARRGEVYAALFDVRGALPAVVVAPFCAAPEGAAARLEAALLATWSPQPRGGGWPEARLALAGSGASLLGPWIARRGIEVLPPGGGERAAAANPEPGQAATQAWRAPAEAGQVAGEPLQPDVARALLLLARAGGCHETEPDEIEPTYLRKSDAELRREQIPPPGA